MRKLLIAGAVAVLGAAAVNAETLQLRVVTDGNAATAVIPPSGATVNVYIQGRFTVGDTGGLALWNVNLKNTGTLPEAVLNLGDRTKFLVTAPTGPVDIKTYFDRNGGVTNPPGPVPGPSGYSGTDDSTAANGLWQIGGAQNTIGNSDPPAYPTGAVQLGVLNDLAWTNLATGSIVVPYPCANTIMLALDTGFANTIDAGDVTSPYRVSEIAVAIVGSLTLSSSGDALRLTAVDSKGDICDLSFAPPFPSPITEPRVFAGNIYRQIFSFDGPPPSNVIPVWRATCDNQTPVPDGSVTCTVAGNTLDCSRVYDPPATYTFDLAGMTPCDPQITIRMLIGDVNGDGCTNGIDRTIIIGVWTGSHWSCVTDLNQDGVTDGTDRTIVIGSWTSGHNGAPPGCCR
jgi:hypothetical protein